MTRVAATLRGVPGDDGHGGRWADQIHERRVEHVPHGLGGRLGGQIDGWRAVCAVAEQQHGCIADWQLRSIGVDTDRRARLVRAELLRPMGPDVHAVGHAAPSPFADAMAAALQGGPEARLAELAAAWLWGWRPTLPGRPSVIVPRGARAPRDGVRFRHCGLTDAERDRQRGIPVTSPARTVIDCAPHLTPDELDRLVADALISPYLRVGALTTAVEAAGGRPGAPALRERASRAELDEREVLEAFERVEAAGATTQALTSHLERRLRAVRPG